MGGELLSSPSHTEVTKTVTRNSGMETAHSKEDIVVRKMTRKEPFLKITSLIKNQMEVPQVIPWTQLDSSASFDRWTFSKARDKKLPSCRTTAIFCKTMANSDKQPRNFRVGVRSKNTFSGKTSSKQTSTSGKNEQGKNCTDKSGDRGYVKERGRSKFFTTGRCGNG